MSISLTPHGERKTDYIQERVDALSEQQADETVIAIGGNFTIAIGGLYRVRALANCRMRVGAATDDATKGEPWTSGEKEVRLFAKGQVVKVAGP